MAASTCVFSLFLFLTACSGIPQVTQPLSPRFPPFFVNMCRISGSVRFLLSVSASMKIAAPPGPYPSNVISSYWTPGSSPVPRWMARLMLSAGMFAALASSTAFRRRALLSTLPPPSRADTVSSLIRRVKILPRLASAAPFLCLIVLHLLWPDIVPLFSRKPPILPMVPGGVKVPTIDNAAEP